MSDAIDPQTPADTWQPDRYDQFRADRERPVHDLLALVAPSPGAHVLDLGCGTGRYTRMVHDRIGAATTVGVDSSAKMLAGNAAFADDDITFVEADLTDLSAPWWDGVDVVFSNAAFQWVPDHVDLLPRIVERLVPGGQLTFQVPSNYDQPSHVVADAVGRDFGLEPLDRSAVVATPARYAEILWAAGLRDLDVSMRVYGVDMARTDDVVGWVSGTLLTSFERRLSADDFGAFREEYRRRLLTELGDPSGDQPYYYALPRILVHGRRPA